MPGYTTPQQLIHLGDHDYRIRALSDRQQFADPDGHAERLGISSAQWCLFGQVWPAARLLAEAMSRFVDVVIGSDVLYERDHASLLAALVDRHTHAESEVVFTDPGRGNSAPFTRALAAQGFSVEEERCPMNAGDTPPYRGHLLHYRRHALAANEAVQ